MSINGKSVVAIIQARTGSTRLPGKVLLEIGGKSSLYYVIERVKRSRYIDKVILATTDHSKDEQVSDLGRELNVKVFRGQEHDVLGRFTSCLDQERDRFDILVRVCGDNFILCPSVIDASLAKLDGTGLDIVNPFIRPTYPFGSGAEVSTVSTLYKIDAMTRGGESKYREHVFFYAYDNPDLFRFDTLEAPRALSRPNLNISVDTQDDFNMVRDFLVSLPPEKRISCDIEDIIHYFDKISED